MRIGSTQVVAVAIVWVSNIATSYLIPRPRLLGDPAARQHMGAGVVHRIDRDQPPARPVLDPEARSGRIALGRFALVALRQTGDLQLELILIRPEPWYRVIGLRLVQDGGRRRLGLIDGVLHALEAQLPSVAQARETRAVA